MSAWLHLLIVLVSDRFKSRRRLEIENLYLRHQLNILMRKAPKRLRLCGADRALMVWMTWRWPNLLSLTRVVSAGHDAALASSRVSRLLALEVALSVWATQDRSRVARTHSPNEP